MWHVLIYKFNEVLRLSQALRMMLVEVSKQIMFPRVSFHASRQKRTSPSSSTSLCLQVFFNSTILSCELFIAWSNFLECVTNHAMLVAIAAAATAAAAPHIVLLSLAGVFSSISSRCIYLLLYQVPLSVSGHRHEWTESIDDIAWCRSNSDSYFCHEVKLR